MGKRRRKYRKVVKRIKRIPEIFQCPNCSNKTIKIVFEKLKDDVNYKKAVVTCGSCGLFWETNVPSIFEAVDVYSKLIDEFNEGRIIVNK
ncbi:MAG: hypothetical protein QXT88_03900 [Desulfurococcaceae archaeon]